MDIYEKMQKPERIKSNSENMLGKISTNENAGMSDDSGGGRRRKAHVELDISALTRV